jgi:hypothetical protein
MALQPALGAAIRRVNEWACRMICGLLQPPTADANPWVHQTLREDRMTFGSAVVVEHRYVVDLECGILADGLEIK